MLQAIFKILIAIIVVRLFAGLVRGLRQGRKRRFARRSTKERVKKPDYRDLTPYDIEDAEFEELPDERE